MESQVSTKSTNSWGTSALSRTIAAIIFSTGLFNLSQASTEDVTTYISAVDQVTQVTRNNFRDEAVAGQSVRREDRIETGGKGRATVSLGQDTDVHIASNSGILIRQLHSSGEDDGGLKGIVTVEKGMIRLESRETDRPIHLRIEQETLKADLRLPASFMVNHNDGTDILCMFEGTVQVQANNDRRELKTPNTCFLYNGETRASSIRNIEPRQVQAVMALTQVNSSPRPPSEPNYVAEKSPSPAPGTTPEITNRNTAAQGRTSVANTVTSATPAPVKVADTRAILDLMRRPNPEGVPEVTSPAPITAKAPTSKSPPTAAPVRAPAPVTRAPVGTTPRAPVAVKPAPTRPAPVSKPAPVKPVAVKPAPSKPAPSKSATLFSQTKPAPVKRAPVTQTSANKPRPVPVSKPVTPKPVSTNRVASSKPIKPIAKPTTRKPSSTARSARRYPTPSGRLEQWTINLAAYNRKSESEKMVNQLREMGYRPVLKKVKAKNGKTFYRLTIGGLKSRIDSESNAKKILAATPATSYWLENVYLTPKPRS